MAEPESQATETTTHFGAKTVPEAEKAGMVRGVFESVASRYDLMNDLMSGGVHRLWKDAMMDWLAPRPGQRLLDVAGGTGDIAFRFLKRAPMLRRSLIQWNGLSAMRWRSLSRTRASTSIRFPLAFGM